MCVIYIDKKITYLNPPRLGEPDRRTHVLTDLRVVVDAAIELQRITRAAWPADYPVPPEVDRINKFVDYAIARARGGSLKTFGALAND